MLGRLSGVRSVICKIPQGCLSGHGKKLLPDDHDAFVRVGWFRLLPVLHS